MVIGSDGGMVIVAYYDKASKSLVRYPTPIPIEQFRGWTLTLFDWERRIEEDTGMLDGTKTLEQVRDRNLVAEQGR